MRFIICFFIFYSSFASAQYISRSEPVPYACPVVCAGGRIVLKIPQIDNLPVGSVIQALLSNASGSFVSGTQTLNATRYSLNQGNIWTNGSYTYTGNVTNLYIEITIPGSTLPGNGYTIKIKASTGYTSNDLFQCSGSNSISVTPYIPPLTQVSQNQQGIGNWIGHVYSWTATTGSLLNTPALINAQTFFGSSNYQGHVLYNPLSLDLNFTSSGGVPGNINNGTSIDCGNSFSQNFSMRLLRQENFTPGFYNLSIQGDDGIRLSIDGGATWILNSFIEQNYTTSLRTTQTAYPNGVCLAGFTNLVIEYFQRPADARLTFTVTPLSTSNFQEPVNATICEFDDTFFSIGTANNGFSYQWFVIQNGTGSFTPLNNGGIYSGVQTGTLSLTGVTASNDNNQYYCEITGPCGPTINSNIAVLDVGAAPTITQQPFNQAFCQGQNISFTIASGNVDNYQWFVSTDGGNSFTPLTNMAPYSGVNSNTLLISNPTINMIGYIYNCVIQSCNNTITSNNVEIITGTQLSIVQEPISAIACLGEIASISIIVNGLPNFQWQINSSGTFTDMIDGSGISGAQTSTLTFSNVTNSLNGVSVRCILTGGCFGAIISQEAVINILQPPVISTQPVNTQRCIGESAVFSIVASGNSLSYQWQLSTDNGITFSNIANNANISGATTAQLTINFLSFSNNGDVYRCVVLGNCPPLLNSQNAQLVVNNLPTFTQQPLGITACEGSSAQFIAQVNDGLEFQWYFSIDNGINFNVLSNGNGFSGVTTSVLTINPINLNLNGAQFQLHVIGCGTTLNSNIAPLTVNPLPKIIALDGPSSVCSGENSFWNVTSNNTLSYVWQINTGSAFVNLSDGNGFFGTSTNSLNIQNISPDLHLAEIRCIASGICSPSDTSEVSIIFIKGVPLILNEPVSTSTCSGRSILLPVVTSGEGLSYQWEIRNNEGDFDTLTNGVDFQGTESATLQLQATNEINGIVVRCVITGCGADAITDTIRITILQDDEVYIPSAFTPDNDKINPIFKLYTEGEPSIDATIYSRWGELIYNWKDKTQGWEGTFNGVNVQEGVYVYRIVVNTACSQKTRMGTVTLLR
jgi:gliding motility-associated-like protein